MSVYLNTSQNELSLKGLLQKNLNENVNQHPPTISYLRKLSGQEKDLNIVELDHNYSKPWNRHPNEIIKSRPAKFLFMENFPKHFHKRFDRSFDINNLNVDDELNSKEENVNFFIKEAIQLGIKTNNFEKDQNEMEEDLNIPSNQNWTSKMYKLYSDTIKILNSDRLNRLSFVDNENEIILRKNLIDKTSSKLRYLFSAIGNWDLPLLNWLHVTLAENLSNTFLLIYVDAIQHLRLKLPALVDKFFTPIKSNPVLSTKISKQIVQADPIQGILNNYKPKRLVGSPLFLIVPNGPQIAHQLTSQRMKHWHNIFGSLGKVITINISSMKSGVRTSSCLKEIRYAVKEKINECKLSFSENRPLVLVGFGHSSLIAASCALESYGQISATICLGFPLTGINGFRGDLDDPLLETRVPTLFIIGQNSTMCTLDDMEDFRERITKAETGLIVVGGANDRLIVCSNKKRFNSITQSIVDRFIAGEHGADLLEWHPNFPDLNPIENIWMLLKREVKNELSKYEPKNSEEMMVLVEEC